SAQRSTVLRPLPRRATHPHQATDSSVPYEGGERMTCSSTRIIGASLPTRLPDGRYSGGEEVAQQEVRCIRPSGHPGNWHHGLLNDLTTVGWEGYAADRPINETFGQEAMDFDEEA